MCQSLKRATLCPEYFDASGKAYCQYPQPAFGPIVDEIGAWLLKKGTKPVISASVVNEHSITYERTSLLKFPEKSFSTATGVYTNYPDGHFMEQTSDKLLESSKCRLDVRPGLDRNPSEL